VRDGPKRVQQLFAARKGKREVDVGSEGGGRVGSEGGGRVGSEGGGGVRENSFPKTKKNSDDGV
jgi:hypothetical protein